MDLLQLRKQKAPVGAPAPAPAAAAPAPAAPAAPAQRGSGFVGFDRYFQANQAGAQRMAQTVGDRVEKEGKEGAAAIQAGDEKFKADSNAANLIYNPAQPLTAEQARALAERGPYAGPKEWDTDLAAKATTEAKEGTDAAANLGSAGGVASLLKESYRSPVTAGASGLDAALAGAAGGSRFAELQKAYGDLSKRLIDARGEAGKTYQTNLDGTKKATEQYGTLAEELAVKEEEARRREEFDEHWRRLRYGERVGGDATPGQWSQEEAWELDDIKRGPRNPRRSVGGT